MGCSKKILVTGASGFVGSALCSTLIQRGCMVCCVSRQKKARPFVAVGDIGPDTDWSDTLKGIDVVVHSAARVHVKDEADRSSLSEFRRVNAEGTANLARQAAGAGVRRLVFISSVKVNGAFTEPGIPFVSTDVPDPRGPYAISKFEAEKELHRIEKDTGLEVVVIRPPLVYGPGVKANFFRLMKLVQKGVPLPFAMIRNKRSLVNRDNLVDLIATCIDHLDAAGNTFLVSDGEDVSTPDLIRKLACAMRRPVRLLPLPPSLLRIGGCMIGKEIEVERLIGSLQVDINNTCQTLGWRPSVSMDDTIRETVQDLFPGRQVDEKKIFDRRL